eukprot:gene9609-7522_t
MGDSIPPVDLGTGRKATGITAGRFHTCAMLDNGDVKCWGNNIVGQLGLGDMVTRGDDVNEMGNKLPVVDLGTGRTATAITAGSYHNCALLDDGSMKCWGSNNGGQLGNGKYCGRGDRVDQMGDNLPAIQFNPPSPTPPSPPQPPNPPGVDLSRDFPRSVMAGVTHTCVLFTNGRVKCWGYLDFLGLGTNTGSIYQPDVNTRDDTRTLPSILDSYVDLGTGRIASTIAVGVSHTCAILDNGDLKCWGDNRDFQLGIKKGRNSIGVLMLQMGDKLPAVDLGTGRSATAIAAGGNHTCALLDNGVLKCWGANNLGQLGRVDTEGCEDMGDDLPAVDLGTGRSATAIAAGRVHTCAILDNADIKCWGHNNWGQLGLSDKETRATVGDDVPAVDLGTGRTATAIAAGEYHTCALLDNSKVKCWGFNIAGELGIGDNAAHATVGDGHPAVDLGTGRTATAIAAGGHHTCALLDNGKLKCWGFNGLGQLGLGDTQSRGDDVGEMGDSLPVVDLGTNRTAITITTNGQHSCALLDDNSVKCWGRNKFGQLGLSDTVSRGGGVAEMGDKLPALQFNPTPPAPPFLSPDTPQSTPLPPSLQIPLAPSLPSSILLPPSPPSLPSPPPGPLLPPFPPNPPVQPYGSWPMPTITTTPRELNKKFDSIPSGVTLTVSDEACKAIAADPTPFVLAFQEQFASDWNSSNPNTPIKNGDVEVTSVNPACSSRRSHRSLLQSSATVITSSSINLPTVPPRLPTALSTCPQGVQWVYQGAVGMQLPLQSHCNYQQLYQPAHRSAVLCLKPSFTTGPLAGVTASASMINTFKDASSVKMSVGSFASNFGVEDVTVSYSTPVTLITASSLPSSILPPPSTPSLPSPPPRPPLLPFPPNPPAEPYGSGPMPTITTTTRVLNDKFDSIPFEVTLTISDEACKAIDAKPTPFILAFKEQLASVWNASNPATPIKNGDVEVTYVNPVCSSRPSPTVITNGSINLPTGLTASASIISALKEASDVGMSVGSFASNFGVGDVTVTFSAPTTLIVFTPPPTPASASDPAAEELEKSWRGAGEQEPGSCGNYTLAITLAPVAVGLSGTLTIIAAVLACMFLRSKKKASMIHPEVQGQPKAN